MPSSDWFDGGYGRQRTRPERVRRGGSWQNHGRLCRSTARDWAMPTSRSLNVGFRVVLVAPAAQRDATRIEVGFDPGEDDRTVQHRQGRRRVGRPPAWRIAHGLPGTPRAATAIETAGIDALLAVLRREGEHREGTAQRIGRVEFPEPGACLRQADLAGTADAQGVRRLVVAATCGQYDRNHGSESRREESGQPHEAPLIT